MLELLELILGGISNIHNTDKKVKKEKKETKKKNKKEKKSKERKEKKKTVFNDQNFRSHCKYKDIYDTDSDLETDCQSQEHCYDKHKICGDHHDSCSDHSCSHHSCSDHSCSDDSSSCSDKCSSHNNHKHDNSHNRNKIIRKLSDVIQQVDTKIISETLQSNLDDYFTKDCSSGVITPKFIQMNVNDTIINVPIYTLVNHTNINIKEFKCKFKTDAYNLGVQCNKNFDIETELSFTRDADIDGHTRINEILLKENF
jgi:hypothetical protein